jgi:hypothetical protein
MSILINIILEYYFRNNIIIQKTDRRIPFTLQIPKKRNVYSAPAVRSVRLKRCKHDFPLRPAASGEKGVPTAAGGRGESPSPESGLLGINPLGDELNLAYCGRSSTMPIKRISSGFQ